MAVRLTIETGADAIEGAADILDNFADRGPSANRYGIRCIAEKLREAAKVERGDLTEDDDSR